MKTAVHGVVVAGGDGILAGLGVAGDAALTPFAGKYRFIDFALASLAHAAVDRLDVAAPGPGTLLRAHLAGAARGASNLRRRLPTRIAGSFAGSRPERIAGALLGCRPLDTPAVTVVVTADHVLQLDVRRLLATHRRLGADVTLCTVPVAACEVGDRVAVDVGSSGRVRGVVRAPTGLVSLWTGDVVVSAGARAMLSAFSISGDVPLALDALARQLTIAAADVDGFWHEPVSVEAYYDAQMNLCTPRPQLDLYDPNWPVCPVGGPYGPAKVVADAAGRLGQALNSLVSDGALVHGGAVFNTVLGHGVVVESGAEVEDSVLLDGCRVGRMARVRRAVVGVGAVIGDAGEIGFGPSPAPPARTLASGLTIVPPTFEAALAVAGAAR
ncbi:MAG TPA: hypothetical protein VKU61_10660 [Candidatus Binatia bacterium]|nr:hypothetical protein [Candidatus Binatia bacterium]